jgi:intracellular sulfur oxidation DsrE/DsrF family protein
MINDRSVLSNSSARRGFLGRLAAGIATFAVVGATPERLVAEAAAADGAHTQGGDWMDELKAPHRTVFDMSAHGNGKPLTQAKNYLDGWRDAFKVPEREINLVMGAHGEAIPVVLTDALWSRFELGKQYSITDGGTKAPAVRNVFTTANATAGALVTPEQSVEGLQKRGVRFLICMNTIAGATKKLVAAGLGTSDDIHSAIMGGLLPGVITVPSMVVALTQLQEHGLKYTKIA